MSATEPSLLAALSQHLIDAHLNCSTVPADVVVPVLNGDAESYAIQQQIIKALQVPVAGWKVGAKSPDSTPNGAPLPLGGILKPGAVVKRSDYRPCGLELEIAFRFDRGFEPRATAYSDEEVWAGIGSMFTTIEVVASRYAGWPNVDKGATLADLGSHAALIVGESIPYRADFPFLSPPLSFKIGNIDILQTMLNGRSANTAGDPRRLLPWVVNHHTLVRGEPIKPDLIVTTGTFTGMYIPEQGGEVRGQIEGFPPIYFTLA